MDDRDLINRLKTLGQHPVPPATASRHLTAMAGSQRPRPSLAHKVRIGAAFAAGLLLGGTGLAAAGALPNTAQEVAHDTLGAMNVHVPPGHAKAAAAHDRTRGKGAKAGGAVSRNVAPEACPDWDFGAGAPRNHGQYVRAMTKRVRELPEAERDAAMQRYAESTCGKPAHAGTQAGDGDS